MSRGKEKKRHHLPESLLSVFSRADNRFTFCKVKRVGIFILEIKTQPLPGHLSDFRCCVVAALVSIKHRTAAVLD